MAHSQASACDVPTCPWRPSGRGCSMGERTSASGAPSSSLVKPFVLATVVVLHCRPREPSSVSSLGAATASRVVGRTRTVPRAASARTRRATIPTSRTSSNSSLAPSERRAFHRARKAPPRTQTPVTAITVTVAEMTVLLAKRKGLRASATPTVPRARASTERARPSVAMQPRVPMARSARSETTFGFAWRRNPIMLRRILSQGIHPVLRLLCRHRPLSPLPFQRLRLRPLLRCLAPTKALRAQRSRKLRRGPTLVATPRPIARLRPRISPCSASSPLPRSSSLVAGVELANAASLRTAALSCRPRVAHKGPSRS